MADEIEQHPKVALRLGVRLKEIVGNEHVTGVRIQPRTGGEEVLPVNGAFVYLQGAKPITDYLGGQLATTDEGCLTVDRELQTAIPGVFAVGDLLCSHMKQAVIAAADGVIAVTAVERYLHGRKQTRVDWG